MGRETDSPKTIPGGTAVPDGTAITIHRITNLVTPVASLTVSGGKFTHQYDGNYGPVRISFTYAGETRVRDSYAVGNTGPFNPVDNAIVSQGFQPGVARGVRNELAVTAGAPGKRVFVRSGAGKGGGIDYNQYSDNLQSPVFADNVSGQSRIDLIGFQTWTPGHAEEGRAELVIVQGTPAASPVEPSYTQGPESSTWFEPLAAVNLPNGYSSITGGMITDKRRFFADPRANSIATANIQDNAITQAKMADNSIGAAEIIDLAVGTNEIANLAVTTAKIADGAITSAKIGTGQIIASNIQNNSITDQQIAPNAIGTSELADNAVDTTAIQNGAVTFGKLAAGEAIPTGVGQIYFGSVAPFGWLICDGSAVSRSTYAALFALFGTTYGAGDGSTTFNLPDLRGRVPAGRHASQTEFDTLGESGGEITHTLTLGEIPSHQHAYSVGGVTFQSNTSVGGAGIRVNDFFNSAVLTTASGGGAAHNNLQPYLTVNWIVKT